VRIGIHRQADPWQEKAATTFAEVQSHQRLFQADLYHRQALFKPFFERKSRFFRTFDEAVGGWILLAVSAIRA
jgi:hypothetical protein